MTESNLLKYAETKLAGTHSTFLHTKIGSRALIGLDGLEDESRALAISTSDFSQEYKPIIDKITNELPFEQGLILIASVFQENKLNKLIYDPQIVVGAVHGLIERQVTTSGSLSETQVSELVKFFRKFGETQVKWGWPIDFDKASSEITSAIGNNSTLTEILLRKIVDQVLFPVMRERPISYLEIQDMAFNAATRTQQLYRDRERIIDENEQAGQPMSCTPMSYKGGCATF